LMALIVRGFLRRHDDVLQTPVHYLPNPDFPYIHFSHLPLTALHRIIV
jgi:hypothetical protein